MKKMIMTLALLASATTYAKLSVFSNTSALQAVLSNTKAMSKISAQMGDSELTSAQITSTGESISKKFTVRLTYTSATPIGDRSCFADVAVLSRPVSHKLPGGGVIEANELAVGKISKNICEK